jgi:ABC-type transport system involved in multi-copper enzyme maturation permease subunit
MSESAATALPQPPSRAVVLRQLAGTLRLELRRSLLARRSLAVHFLAFAPVALVALWAFSPFPLRQLDGVDEAATLFAVMFEAYLRVSIFFSALFLFVNLYRAEILERSLHYYFLAPVRREVVAGGKYLAALVVGCSIFVLSTALLFVLTLVPWGGSAFATYVLRGPGLGNLLAYLAVVVMAFAGYGAIFLVIGLLFRNPVIPAAILWLWEAANLALPPLLKRFSVVFYLQSIYPVPISRSLFEVVAEPPPVWLSVLGGILVTLAVLAFAGWKVRRMEISYGGE